MPLYQEPTTTTGTPHTTSTALPQHPFVYYPQVVMGQNGQPQYFIPQQHYPVMEQQASSSIPLENNLPVEGNQSMPTVSGPSNKFSKFLKENGLLTAQIIICAIMSIFCISAIFTYVIVGVFMVFKMISLIVCCIAAFKKKYLALSFFNGAILMDMILSSIGLIILQVFVFAVSNSNEQHTKNEISPIISLPFQLPFLILELAFLVISIVLTYKIHRQVHSVVVPVQENTVPVMVMNGSTTEIPIVQQGNYSRLEESQEGI